jgi:predicted metalloprotease with PDZ domain
MTRGAGWHSRILRCASPRRPRRPQVAFILPLIIAALTWSARATEHSAQAAGKPQRLDLEYHLRLARPTTHLIEVEITASGVTEPTIDFVMPAWAPGRYAIYNFAKNVQEFTVTSARGQLLPWSQPDKETWRVQTAGSDGTVRVRYRVFANTLTGSFSQFDSTHANINGAGIYVYIAGHKSDPLKLTVESPAGWQVISAFSLAMDRHSFQVPDYDRLIDTPMEVSPECRVDEFTEAGKTFRVVVHSYGSDDGTPLAAGSDSASHDAGSRNSEASRLVDDLKKIVHSEVAMMSAPDFEHYTFLFHFAPDLTMGDGMEHLNSTQIMIRAPITESSVTEALETAAHEFFHLWNVKRLRPAALGPFDYTKENYTKSLWFAEGLTQYYSYVHLLRAGLWTRQEFLDRLAGEVRSLELEPGRSLMSAESSSFHAWFYDRAPQMQETNFADSTTSYYNKGALLGMLLDLEIRARTQGMKSLDDVMRLMFHNFYQAPGAAAMDADAASSYDLPGRGYQEEDILSVVNSVSGTDFAPFFERYVRGTEALPYRQTLAQAGLKLEISAAPGSPPSLSMYTRQDERGLRIVDVLPGSAADRAGLSTDDLLIDIDQFPLVNEDLRARLKIYPPGAEVPFGVERHGRKLRITVKLGPPAADQYSIEEAPGATPGEVHIRDGWLGK